MYILGFMYIWGLCMHVPAEKERIAHCKTVCLACVLYTACPRACTYLSLMYACAVLSVLFGSFGMHFVKLRMDACICLKLLVCVVLRKRRDALHESVLGMIVRVLIYVCMFCIEKETTMLCVRVLFACVNMSIYVDM
jgi:hypothetical protein